jgi:hypothetical protein
MCLPGRCLVMNIYSDFTMPAFGRHFTISSCGTSRLLNSLSSQSSLSNQNYIIYAYELILSPETPPCEPSRHSVHFLRTRTVDSCVLEATRAVSTDCKSYVKFSLRIFVGLHQFGGLGPMAYALFLYNVLRALLRFIDLTFLVHHGP